MNLAADVTVVLTSCGRQDLLERTLDSFFAMNTYEGIAEILVTEDSGIDGVNDALKAKYADRPLVWIDDEGRRGQIACIDDAYARVRTPLVFHCEDDWHFYHPGFIEASKAILAHDDRILQVWLRAEDDTNGHPLDEPVFEAPFGGACVRYRYVAIECASVWHGFSFNPGLRRLADYHRIAPFRDVGHETDISIRYCAEGFRAVLLLRDDGGRGFVEHIGGGRHVDDEGDAPSGGVQ